MGQWGKYIHDFFSLFFPNYIFIQVSSSWIVFFFWQVGYSYECLLESTFTGYMLHCRGWKSVYLYPKRPCFLGCTTIDMKDATVQLIKWTSSLLGIALSKSSPLTLAMSSMSILQSMCYAYITFTGLFAAPLVIYGVVLPISLLKGFPIFPKVKHTLIYATEWAFAILFLIWS